MKPILKRLAVGALAGIGINAILFFGLFVACSLSASVHAQKPLDEQTSPAVKKLRRELTPSQRIAVGATYKNVIRIVRELRRDGEIDDETSHAEIAAAVVSRLEKENPKSFSELAKGDRDWASFLESLAAFVERILPLILKLIG